MRAAAVSGRASAAWSWSHSQVVLRLHHPAPFAVPVRSPFFSPIAEAPRYYLVISSTHLLAAAVISSSTSSARLLHFFQTSALDVVDISINRNVRRNERVRFDTLDIRAYAFLLVADGEPFNEIARVRSGTSSGILPFAILKRRRLQTLGQQAADHFIREIEHAAVGMVNHEPFSGSQKFVRNHQRSYGIIAGPPAGIPDYVSISFREPGKFRRIEARIHTGQNCETACRWHCQFGLLTKLRGIGTVSRENLFQYI